MSQGSEAAIECREALSAWSLLPLSRTLGGPKAPASWTHSIRFARFASGAAQPVRTPLTKKIAYDVLNALDHSSYY